MSKSHHSSSVEQVLDLIKLRASETPEKCAIQDSNRAFTYRDFLKQLEEYREVLLTSGIHSGMRVAVHFGRRTELPAFVCALWSLGVTYVPIPPGWKADKITSWLTNVQCEVLASIGDASEGRSDVTLSRLTRERTTLASSEPTATLAYIIGTSGSTEAAKAVAVGFDAITASLLGQATRFKIRREDKYLFFSSTSFDPSIAEMLLGLMAGATTFVYPETYPRVGEPLRDFLVSTGITFAGFTPAILRTFSPESLVNLATVVSGGAAPDSALLATWAVGRRFINAYGPTECSICSFSAELSPDGTPHDIGLPLPGVEYIVMSQHGPSAPGDTGELWLSGAFLANGYLYAPDDSRFFYEKATAHDLMRRYFATGDIVQVRQDGGLSFIGRRSNRRKVNEIFVDFDEMASAIKTKTKVTDVVISQERTETGLDVITIWFTCTFHQNRVRDEIHAVLSSLSYRGRVPVRIYQVSDLQLLESGKVTIPRFERPSTSITDGASSLTSLIEQIWLNKINSLGGVSDDTFFDAGGTSLDAMELLSEIAAVSGTRPNLQMFYQSPTLEGVLNSMAFTEPRTRYADNTIVSHPELPSVITAPKRKNNSRPSALLTGVTGYLGAHILERILECRTFASITCPIRAHSVSEAREKLTRIWRDKDLRGDVSKVEIIVLGSSSWNALATYRHSFDSIIHCAVDKNALASQADLWEVNVEPALHLLATLTHSGRFIFCSSIAVEKDESRADEMNGYALSKKATEELLLRHSLPSQEVVIYRLPALFPDRRAPRWNEKDFIARVVSLSMRLSAFPILDGNIEVPWMGVSEASDVLAQMATAPPGANGGSPLADLKIRYSKWEAFAQAMKTMTGARLISWHDWVAEGLACLTSRTDINHMRAVRAVSKFYLSESTRKRVHKSNPEDLEASLEAGIQWSTTILRRSREDTAQANIPF